MLWTCGSIASSTCVCDLPPECECPNLDQYRQSADVDHQTDDEVLNLCFSVPKKDWTTLGCPPRLTPDVVAKRVPRLPTGLAFGGFSSGSRSQPHKHPRSSYPAHPQSQSRCQRHSHGLHSRDHIGGSVAHHGALAENLYSYHPAKLRPPAQVHRTSPISNSWTCSRGRRAWSMLCVTHLRALQTHQGPICNLGRTHPVVQQRNGSSCPCPIVRAQGAIAG